MQQEEWVLPLPTYIMGAVRHEMGIRSSQLISVGAETRSKKDVY